MDHVHDRNPAQGAPLLKKRDRHQPRDDTVAAWMALALQALARPMASVYRNLPLSEEAIFHAVSKALSIWTSNPGYFVSPAHLLNWLKRTAFWVMVDWYRKDQRCPLQPLPAENGSYLPDPQSLPRPPQRWTAEDKQVVWDCLQQLPEVERRILEGHYYEKLTDVELAKRLYPKRTASPALGLRVWRLRQKALAHLRQFLQQRGVVAA